MERAFVFYSFVVSACGNIEIENSYYFNNFNFLPGKPLQNIKHHVYRSNSFIVDLRHKFTVRNMNEIPVFVQSSELSNIT